MNVQLATSPHVQAKVTGDQSAAPPRRRQGARRLLLLQTTLKLIAEHGIDGVNHRTVAEAAGVPLGSTTYWFSSRQEMLLQALEHFARIEIEALRERLAGVLGGAQSRASLVDEFTEFLLPQLGEQRWRTAAQYALLQEASRRQELQPVCREWTAAWQEALAEVFSQLGVLDPTLEAKMFLGMLDGLLLEQIAAPSDDVENTVIRPVLEAWFDRIPGGRS